jgi:hypothetical protein
MHASEGNCLIGILANINIVSTAASIWRECFPALSLQQANVLRLGCG